ncbi:MAG: heme NO-binding domain-containing protein [Cytophagales bacterium]|nr:heme NO-binding domain-containing protein [Cytophagales bacterium]
MKGIIFTELMEMVEGGHGLEIADKMLSHPELSTKGVYIATGTYPVEDLEILLGTLQETLGADRDTLLKVFSGHLFQTFEKKYASLLANYSDTFGLLKMIEGHIHVEVKKLYPDAELPEFQVESETSDQLVLIYTSSRHMEALAEGLMEAAAKHFQETFDIRKEKTSPESTRFILSRT